MPTLKPKRTFVYSSEEKKRLLETALTDRCEISRKNMSQEIEDILLDTLIPHDGGLAEDALTRIYRDMTTVQEEISIIFCDASDIHNSKIGTVDLRPLVELADRQSIGTLIDSSPEANESFQSIRHLMKCWESICKHLHRICEDGGGDPDALLTVDEDSADALSRSLADGKRDIEAKAFFDIVLRNWSILGKFPNTYIALMDILGAVDKWPEDARAREDLKACLWAISNSHVVR